MLIDWFTVVAQALNFLILVWLMRRFLYRPILHAIDEREKRIAGELADADAKRVEAKAERDEFQQKNELFEQERTQLVAEATREAREQAHLLLVEARQAADDLSKKREKALQEEVENLGKNLALRTQDEVFSIARKVLADLASTKLEAQICEVFIRRLRELDGREKSDFAAALNQATDPVLLRSGFALSPEQSSALGMALNETFSGEFPLRFETVPALIGGIELTTIGQKVSWNMADYLRSVENDAREFLARQDKSVPEGHLETSTESKNETVIP